jgi:hypothetical protein
MGNKDDEVVRIEYHEIEQTIKLEQEFEGNGWTELFKTPGNRHRVIILIALGFFFSMVWKRFSFILHHRRLGFYRSHPSKEAALHQWYLEYVQRRCCDRNVFLRR